MKKKTRQLLEKLGIIAWLINHNFMAAPKVLRSYDQIIGTFTSISTELNELRKRRLEQIRKNSEEIRRLTQDSAAANSEMDKATNAANNIDRLFQPAQVVVLANAPVQPPQD